MSHLGRAIELRTTIKILGKSGVEELVDELCCRAQQFAQQMGAQGFLFLKDIVFNQVLVTCDTLEQTAATLKNLQQSGKYWCGRAK